MGELIPARLRDGDLNSIHTPLAVLKALILAAEAVS